MNSSLLFTTADPNPRLDYVAHREAGKERRNPDYFAKLMGCKKGLRSWSTGSGPTADHAIQDALNAWEAEGKP